MNSKWKIEPLEGKYYGTQIVNEQGSVIKVWLGEFNEGYRASDRELANGWEPDWGYDHVELQEDYEIALEIVRALNGS